jgi:uncharacterized protein (DUF952 family)
MIYHILTSNEWERAREQESYIPDTFTRDGFIHLCEAKQMEGVIRRYFTGQDGLVALCVAVESLRAPLRYENLLGGDELFPHLYGPLNLDAVTDVIALHTG